MSGKRIGATGAPSSIGETGNPVVIVGAGHMGGAFARGYIAAGLGPSLVIVDPAIPADTARSLSEAGARIAAGPEAIGAEGAAALILAVKPQVMPRVAPPWAGVARDTLVISIAAGTTLDSLGLWLGRPRGLVRAMPNLPASIGCGITAACATPSTSVDDRNLADWLLRAVGDLVWLDAEQLMDAVTAVSGSGPAYVFLLAEAMAAAGEKAGLPPATARLLARRTVEGAGALLEASPADPGDLRRSVTSPGGTTEAALKVLDANGHLGQLVGDAVTAAVARAAELAKSS